jgi:hypothetical protein
VALCPQDVTLAIVLVVYRPYASAVFGTMHCSWTPLWECMPRSVFNIVAAQQSTKDRNLQDCNTIALSLEYMHHSRCSGENRSVIHSCHSWVDTSLCQRCEVVVLSSGMPTALYLRFPRGRRPLNRIGPFARTSSKIGNYYLTFRFRRPQRNQVINKTKTPKHV